MSENKRYYWLKLQENFFDDDTIDFIESQENGEKYVLFYLKLCLKALKNEGKLIRCVGEMLLPYDDSGIAKLTRTNIDVVRSALSLFNKIGLIKKLDSGEIYLTQLNEMVGTETQKAKYMRERRLQDSKKITMLPESVTMLPECYKNVTQSIEYRDKENRDIELEKEKDIECTKSVHLYENYTQEKQQRQKRFIIPSVEEIAAYCRERNNTVDAQHFFDYYESKGWVVGKAKMKDWRATVRNWERTEKKFEPAQKMQKREQLTDEEYRADCDDLDNITY